MSLPALLPDLMRRGVVALGVIAIVAPGCEHKPASTATSGSAGQQTAGGRTAPGFAQFPDIAVPAGTRMDLYRTLVFGARDDWIGRLAMTSGETTTAAYDFYLREMPKFGWREITTVRSEISVLTYDRGDRVATVQIQKRPLGGAQIDITVSPRGRPAAFPAAPATTASPR